MPIVQTDTDQVNPRTFQCEHHLLQIPRLFEPETADDIVDRCQLVHPLRAL
ncbi:hypothetical protein D3C71_2084360 [compost metagenome]